jgi:MFS family permease
MSYTQGQDPHPASAAGIILGFVEGIVLALINWYVTILFSMLADIQQQLNPETVVFNVGFVFSAWGIAYFFIAYIAPILAAYVWADKAGLAVYAVGWIGTSLILNGAFTVGMILLFVAILLVIIVDVIENVGNRRRRGGYRRPPM